MKRPEELDEPSALDRLMEWTVAGFAIGAVLYAAIFERLFA